MKHFLSKALLIAALALALVLGVVALAENTGTEAPELPAASDVQGAEEQPSTGDAGDTADDAALQDALNAYRAAQQSSRAEELEAELNGYVASGKLTQEQADLILKYYKDRESLRNGVCPSCGYQFQNSGKGGFGKGGRGNGGFGKGNNGSFGGGRGQRGFGAQQAPGDRQAPSGSANGTAFAPDAQAPNAFTADEGI